MILRICVIVVIGYLLGNFNGALIVSTRVFHDDVRNHGSGNAGMTNFLRTYGKKNLLPVILIDLCKAILACLVGWLLLHSLGYSQEGKMLGGMACLLGHALPFVYGFRGGKGVLSACGVAFCMCWWSGLAALAIFFLVLGLTHYVSLSSICGVIVWSILAVILFWGHWFIIAAAVLLAVLVVFLHRTNIQRLLRGNERKTYLFR